MNNSFITENSGCLTINKREYSSQLSFSSSRIRQDKKIELDMKQEYSGRELYEMIQNADDEGSPRIELELTTDNHLHIKNWGNRPFTEGGLLSIMRSFLSTKTDEIYKNAAVKPIGNKGLGFRSLLNWSDEITIHSNGVQCSFSEEIAKKEWGHLKQVGLHSGSLSEEDLRLFENEHIEGLPLPILSIPEVQIDDITKQNTYNIDGVCTTDVEVRCKDESVVSDIKQKLTDLPCTILLFLRNIKKIDIICNGINRTIKKIKTETKNSSTQIVYIKDNDNEARFVISRYISEDRSYEVGVAYPLTQISITHVLYSYFPTQVRLNVPAIYHGTFELNASRNHLVNSSQNSQVLKKLGEVAIQLSDYLTANKLLDEQKKWDSFNLLNLSKSDIESAMLIPLAESIQSNLHDANIFPIINSDFSCVNSSIWIGHKFATWLMKAQREKISIEPFKNHLINTIDNTFSHEKHLSEYVLNVIKKNIDDASDWIEEQAQQSMSKELRAEFIDAIIECGYSTKKLSILIDAKGVIINSRNDNSPYVLSIKGNSVLPKCLNVSSVDSDLVNLLGHKWNLQIRQVTEKLQRVTNVINGDHSAIRKKIESWSMQEIDYEGMCEVLKWEYNNPTHDSTAFTSDLHLLNRNNERKPACCLIVDEPTFPIELANKVDNNWWLIGSLSEWKETLGAETEDEALNFLYNVIGVSQRVPLLHSYYGDNEGYLNKVRDYNNKSQIPNQYFNHFGSANRITKQYNYAYIPCEIFLSKFSITEAISLILSDKRAMQEIMNNSISLFYRSLKSEIVKYSYPAYILRSYKQFFPLQMIVIHSSAFGCNIDYDYIEKNMSIDRISRIYPLLVSLGAQVNLNNFSVEELYNLLSQKSEPVGIQKRYKELREAIRNKNVEEWVITNLKTKYLSNVWARINGKLEWLPVEQVYYWDNDQLPQTILSNLPKLEIGSRVGEDSVAKIFGVKLAKNIDISFNDYVENQSLTSDLKKYLSEKIKYFLAYRISDDIKDSNLIRQSVSSLKQLSNNLHIYRSSSYSVNGEIHTMKEGDILTTSEDGKSGIHYYICSAYPNCINAIEDPVFCESLNEAVCMALKVTSSTMSNYFRNIITHDNRYLDYITKKDITPEIWTLVLKNLGISEYEQHFWKTYSDSQDRKMDIGQLAEHILSTKDYILSIYPELKLPDNYTEIADMKPFEQYDLLVSMRLNNSSLLGINGLKAFYMEYFNVTRNRYTIQYNSCLFHRCSEKIKNNKQNALDIIMLYQKKCQEFMEPFYEDKAEEIKTEVLAEEKLNDILHNIIREKFYFSPDPNFIKTYSPETILPQYEKILSDYHLSEGNLDQTDALVAKFEGLEDLFRERLKTYDDSDISTSNKIPSESDVKKIPIDYPNCHSVLRDLSTEINNKKNKRKAKGYVSDRTKYRVGKYAELMTYEAMKSSSLFEDVSGCSTILNKEGGNDDLHYDISYRKTGSAKTDLRYLEVKAMSGNSIIMSCMEYQFAKEHCEQYDFAIFHDGKISIIENPFSSKGDKIRFEVQPDTYQITIEWD